MFVIGLAQYFVIEYEADFDLVPSNELLALDHSQFIASMSSAVIAMLVAATAGRVDRRLEQATFALVSIGVIVFVAGLLADVTALKRIGAPTMGIGLIVGLVGFVLALAGRPDVDAASNVAVSPAG